MIGKKGLRSSLKLYLPDNAFVLAFSSAIWGIGSTLVSPFQSIFYFALGTPLFYIGVLAAVNSIVSALMLLVGGYVADTWGRKRVLVLFGFVSAVAALIYLVIGQWPLLFLPVIINAVTTIYSPAFNATLNDSMEPKLRPMGFASFAIVTTIPSIFAPFLGGMLISSFGTISGLKIGFAISAILGMISMAWRSRKLKETYVIKTKRKRESVLRILSNVVRSNLEVLKVASRDAKLLLWYAAFSSVASSLSTVYISLYLINTLKIAPSQYGFITGISAVVTILLILPTVSIIKRVGLKKAAILSALSSPASMLIFVSSNGMNDLLAWSITGGVSGALVGPTIQSMQGNSSSSEIRGRLMGLFSFIPLIVSMPAQIFSGFLYSNVSHISTFILAIPFYVIAIMVLSKIETVR